MHREPHRDVVLADAVQLILARGAAAPLMRDPQRADRDAALARDRHQLHRVWLRVAPALLGGYGEHVPGPLHDCHGAVGVANPDLLGRLYLAVPLPRITDLAAGAEEVAFGIDVEVAHGAERRPGKPEADAHVADHQAGGDHQGKEHAAADDFATP